MPGCLRQGIDDITCESSRHENNKSVPSTVSLGHPTWFMVIPIAHRRSPGSSDGPVALDRGDLKGSGMRGPDQKCMFHHGQRYMVYVHFDISAYINYTYSFPVRVDDSELSGSLLPCLLHLGLSDKFVLVVSKNQSCHID